MKQKLFEMDGALYCHISKITVCREYGKSPNGNDIHGRWVLRREGEFIDMNTYQIDLMQRNKLDINGYERKHD